MEQQQEGRKGPTLVFDLEADGLLTTISKLWILCTLDLESQEARVYSDYDPTAYGSLEQGINYLFSAGTIINHNAIGYDLLAIRKVTGRTPPKNLKVYDTLLFSQVLNYKRFANGRHNLETWGNFLGYPKQEHEDWSTYSPEMRSRCVIDVELTAKVWNYLIKELNSRTNKETLKIGIESEHWSAKFVAEAEFHGWPMDVPHMLRVKKQLEDEIDEIKKLIEPKLSLKVQPFDSRDEVKSPAWVKTGDYAVRTAEWFGFQPSRGQEGDRPVWGDYCRVEVVQPDITSMESVKGLLFELGWEPLEWNWVRDRKTGKLIRSSPQLCEISLAALGEVGRAVDRYYTLRGRLSILEGWLKAINPETHRLHGSVFLIGTPTFRARHSVIANVASPKALYGKEFRQMFTSPPGYKVVGADSSGNQLRSLAHWVNSPELTDVILNGDIHSFNAKILESVVGSLGDSARDIAKPFVYAFLFAGGDGKLALIVTGKRDAELGARLRKAIMKKIVGFEALVKKLEKQWEYSYNKLGKGYIQGLDGRPVFAEAKRLVLNYCLMSTEAITCKAAVMVAMKRLEEEGIPYQPLVFYHDELEVLVEEQYAERTSTILREAFRDAPKLFGVEIMDGASKIGDNWYEVH